MLLDLGVERTHRWPSLAVVVLGNTVLEQHYARHPRALFKESVDRAVVNGENPLIRQEAGRARG